MEHFQVLFFEKKKKKTKKKKKKINIEFKENVLV